MSAVEQVLIPTFERVRNGKRQTVPAHQRRGSGPRLWPSEKIIEVIRLWNETVGEPPRCADWNPSMARQLNQARNINQRVGLYASGH